MSSLILSSLSILSWPSCFGPRECLLFFGSGEERKICSPDNHYGADDGNDEDDDDDDNDDDYNDDNDDDDVKVHRLCSPQGDYHYHVMMTAITRMREKLIMMLNFFFSCYKTPTVKFLKSRSHQSFLT